VAKISLQHRIRGLVALHREELAGEQLDAAHVGEVLADGFFVVPRERSRRDVEGEVPEGPLLRTAAFEHAREIHGAEG
jgi:hypothetical protein